MNVRTLGMTLCLISCCLVVLAPAQQQTSPQRQAPPPISVQNIKGNIFQVKGGAGANTGFFVADKEVVVIDAKMTEEAAKQMLAEIRKVTPNQVTKIVLTHSDGDHVNGLVGFPAGLDIISHDNTRDHMVKAFESEQQLAHLPTITFSDKLRLHFGSGKKTTRVDLFYFGPAHTNGDAVVFFPEEKVAFIGDLMFLGRDPLIHRAKNGTSFGLVKVLKELLSLDAETYASGHNELTTKKEIQDFLQSVVEKQAKIHTMVNAGKTLDDVKKAFNIETPAGGSRWPSLVEVIYLDITEKKQRSFEE
jgi:glyoxylase-like metal-dependent hydrolase (beta-lactamase superfamily II)